MKESTKLIVAVGGGLVAGYFLFKPKDVGLPAGNRPSARMGFAAAPPASMTEGASGSMSVTVVNTSKRAGVNVPYTFGLLARIYAGGVVAYSSGIQVIEVSAGGSMPATFPFVLSAGKTGVGYAEVILTDPTGNTQYATTGQFVVTINPATVVPAGTIAW